MKLLLAAVITAFVPAFAQAQGCVFMPDAAPSTGPASIHPFGDTDPNDPQTANQALVFRVPLSRMPQQPVRITALGFASAGNRSRRFGTTHIRLGQTQNPTLNPVIPLNMQGFTAVVHAVENWEWNTPADRWTFIGLSAGYPFDPANGDLVIEMGFAGATSSGSGSAGFRSDPNAPCVLQTGWRFQIGRGVVTTGAPKVRVCWDAADLQTFGGGCVGSNGKTPRLVLSGTPRLGQSINIGLRDASTSSFGAVLFMSPRLRARKFDLTPFGSPCILDVFFDLNEALPMQNGSIDVPVTVPTTPALVGGSLWGQWMPLDAAANALGVTSSTFGRILVGS